MDQITATIDNVSISLVSKDDFFARLSSAVFAVHYHLEGGSTRISLADDGTELERLLATAPEGTRVEVFVRPS